MNDPRLLAAMGAALLMVLGVLAVLLRLMQRADRITARIGAMRRGIATDEAAAPETPPGLLGAVVATGMAFARSGLLPRTTLEELRQTLRIAGLNGPHGLGLFIGAKALLALGLPGLVMLIAATSGISLPMPQAIVAGAAAIGLLAPDYVVKRRRRAYLRALEVGLPDALDMMVICTEAGLGLESGISRVAGEIASAHPAVAEEFRLTAQEMRINADQRQALLNVGKRTGLESLRRFAATLIQSLQYGTPMSQALRTLSAEQRHETLMRFEARAARLPVLLTMPMIVFVLPCVFLIVAGPAAVKVFQTLGH